MSVSLMCRTSPEEFLARLADAEEQRKKSNQKFGGGCGGDNEREFSLPTRPKQDVRGGGAAMTREKVLVHEGSQPSVDNIHCRS